MYEVRLHGVTVDTKLSLQDALIYLSRSQVSKWFKSLYKLNPNGTKSLVVFISTPVASTQTE